MEVIQEKFLQKINESNRLSFVNFLYILSICFFIGSFIFLRQGFYLTAVFIFAYGVLYVFLAILIKRFKSNIDKYFICSYYSIILYFYLFGYIFSYLGNLATFKRYYYMSIIGPEIILKSRTNENNLSSFLSHVTYLVSLFSLPLFLKYIFGDDEFYAVFDDIDLLCSIFVFLSTIAIKYSENKYFNNYNNIKWENEFHIEKFKRLHESLIFPNIQVDMFNFKVEYNNSFIELINKMASEENVAGFLGSVNNKFEIFQTEISNSREYEEFYEKLSAQIELDKSKTKNSQIILNNYELSDLVRERAFFIQLFYLNKILNNFKTKKENQTANLFEDIFYFSRFFTCEEKSESIGNFIIESKDDIFSIELLYRKAIALNTEVINILLYDTTSITKMEKAIIETENANRSRYLSLVSDKFFTPIQVLIHTVKNMPKRSDKKDENSEFACRKDIENLGTYICSINEDINTYARKEKGYEITTERFSIKKLFDFSQQLVNLLIMNNSAKRFALTTELVINSDVPEFVYSDLSKIRQVLVNLVMNAYKFTLAGSIKILVKLNETNENCDEIVVYVDDTGIGVCPEFRDYLFQEVDINNLENITANRKGFGLQICCGIIKALGGKLGYTPLEKGSSFYFTFFNKKYTIDPFEKVNKGKYFIYKFIDLNLDVKRKNSYGEIDTFRSQRFKSSQKLNISAFDEIHKNPNQLSVKSFTSNSLIYE